MVLLQILSIFLIAGAIFFFLCKTKDKDNFIKILQIVAICLSVIFVCRYMLGDEAIRDTLKLECETFNNKFLTFVAIILVWFNFCVNIVLTLQPFFNLKTPKDIIKVFCLPITVSSVLLISIYTKAVVGTDAYTVFDIRTVLLTIELSMTLALCVFTFVTDKEKVKSKDAIKILLLLAVLLLAVMPPYTIQGILGYAKTLVRVKNLSSLHRLVLYFSVILPVILYIWLKNKDEDFIYYVILFISLGTLLSFSLNARFERFLRPTSWPLHLCNTAMYIIPLCLIFKMKKLFYFTYFINVLGAFFAMAMPNYSTEINAVTSSIVLFYINHYIAFFMPLLCVGLNIFKRPGIKEFKYSMIAFFVYFVLMVVINAWFTNYDAGVDFFFLNSDFIADKLGNWARNLRNITLIFYIKDLKFVLYPVYQILFFVVYIFLGLGMWFVYSFLYTIADHFEDMRMRRQKIQLDYFATLSNMEGRDIMQPANLDGVNKLVIQNFKKKYAVSKTFAVKGINLTINSGEIFGFLGPNGAGKSSTIKCIVGIQGLTAGKIYANGYDVETQSIEAKRQIGFVPDHYALYEKLTGREYINYIADIYGVGKERNKLIEKYVKLFELTDSFDSAMRTYSHGMKQKIAIMSALVHNPKIWILDEPLTGLDPNSIYQVKECMKEHARNGNIVFFSSHIIDIVERLCDRIAIIKSGEIIATDTVQNIIDSGVTLEEYYLQNINGTTDLSSLKEENKDVPEGAGV